MPVAIELLINAQNNASAELARVGRDFADLERRTSGVTQTFSQTGRQVRVLAGDMVSQLNPALGGVVMQATMAGGAMQGMSGAAAGVTAAVALAAAALGAYVKNLHETAERQAALNIAVRGFDAGPIRGQLAGISTEMEKLSLLSGGVFGVVERTFRRLTDAVGFSTAETEKLTAAQIALNRVLPLERAQVLTDAYGKQQETLQGLLAVEMQRAQASTNLSAMITLTDRMTQALSNQASAEEKLIDLQREKDLGAARARHEPQAALDLINERAAAAKRALGQRTLNQVEAARFAGEQTFFAGSAAQSQRDVEAAGSLEQVLLGPTPEEKIKGLRQRQLREQDDLALAQQRAQIQTTLVGLTNDERDARALVVIEAEKQLKLALATNDPDRQDLATLEAKIQAYNVLRQQRERNDPVAGLAKGFKDAAEEASASGQIMQDLARNTARGMQQAWSEGFFDVITGNFKKLPDVARTFAMAMVREFTDAAAKMATAPLLRGLQSAFGGGAGVPGFGTAAMLPGSSISQSGGAPGIGPSPLAESRWPDVTGSGTPIRDDAAQAAYALAAGQQGLFSQAADTARRFWQASILTPVGGMSQAQLERAVLAGDLTAEQAAQIKTDQGALAGVTVGQTVGTGLSLAAAGVAIYGAYQGGSPAAGAITGGVAGLSVGLQAGGGNLYAAAAGALIGAIAGGVAGGFGQSENERKAELIKKREREVNTTIGAANALIRRVEKASSVEEIYKLLQGAVGGSTQITTGVTLGTTKKRAGIGAGATRATLQDFLKNIGSLQASVHAGVSQDVLGPANAEIVRAVQSAVAGLQQVESQVNFQYTKALKGRPNLQQTTILPAFRMNLVAGQGLDLEVLEDTLANLDPNAAAALLKRLAEVDADQDLQIIRQDPGGEVVSSRSFRLPRDVGANNTRVTAGLDTSPTAFGDLGGGGGVGDTGASGPTGSAGLAESEASTGLPSAGINIGGFNLGGALPAISQGAITEGMIGALTTAFPNMSPTVASIATNVGLIGLGSVPVVGQILSAIISAVNFVTSNIAQQGYVASQFVDALGGPQAGPTGTPGGGVPGTTNAFGESVNAQGFTVGAYGGQTNSLGQGISAYSGNVAFSFAGRGTAFTDDPNANEDPQGTTIASGEGGSAGASSVICTEFHRQGYLDDATWAADGRYGRAQSRAVLEGYWRWGKPVARAMATRPWLTRLIWCVGRPWSEEMAFQMGARQRGSRVGRLIMAVGTPLCAFLGQREVRGTI